MVKIIAPVGYARVGKDEFAKVLVEEHGYTRFAFADKLRDCVYALNPIVVSKRGDSWRPVQAVIEEYGWDGYKESVYGDAIRGLLQRMGTEVGRDLIDENIWLRELDKVESDKIVITDARFGNELQYVLNKGGSLIHVKREGFGPVNGHISETAHLEYVDKVVDRIWNNGTLEEYRNVIKATIKARGL